MHCVYNSPYGQPKVHATHPAGTNLVSTEKFLRADVADVLNVISVNPVWELTSLQCCGFRKEAAASSCLRISWLPQLSPTPAEKKISSPACCKVLQLRWHLRERRGGVTLHCVVPFPWVKKVKHPPEDYVSPSWTKRDKALGGVSEHSRPHLPGLRASGSNTHLWSVWRHVFGHNIVGLMSAAIQEDRTTCCCNVQPWTNTL